MTYVAITQKEFKATCKTCCRNGKYFNNIHKSPWESYDVEKGVYLGGGGGRKGGV